MRNRLYYDPHYKPDRTASKYAADKKRDAKSQQATTVAVEKILKKRKKARPQVDPAERFEQQRAEVRRRRLSLEDHKSSRRTLKSLSKAEKKERQAQLRGTRPVRPVVKENTPNFPKARLELGSSEKFLSLSGEQLLVEYENVESKIDMWRAEYDNASEGGKRQLASQLQIQYLKRRDLLALLEFKSRE